MMANAVTIHKRDHNGAKLLEYGGEVLARGETWVCVRARFNFPDKDAGYVVFRQGDTFVERYYSDRWYNVFTIYDVDDGHHKGWYCNVTRPAELGENLIAADDLALDVFVSPQRKILILDEDEFAALDLPPDDQRAAWDAVEAIKRAAAAHESPFDLPVL